MIIYLMTLSACSTAPIKTEVLTVYTPKYVELPSDLTNPVPMPEHKLVVNSDLSDYIIMLKTALEKANLQLQSIKEIQPWTR